MSAFTKLPLAKKLPIAITCMSMCLAIGMSLVGYYAGASALKTEETYHLESVLEARQAELKQYLGSIEQDLRFVASNPTTREALSDFTGAWKQLGNNATSRLQRLYIDDNPHPTGKKEELDAANDSSAYQRVAKYEFQELSETA